MPTGFAPAAIGRIYGYFLIFQKDTSLAVVEWCKFFTFRLLQNSLESKPAWHFSFKGEWCERINDCYPGHWTVKQWCRKQAWYLHLYPTNRGCAGYCFLHRAMHPTLLFIKFIDGKSRRQNPACRSFPTVMLRRIQGVITYKATLEWSMISVSLWPIPEVSEW